ncbi:MAG: hypothetical protein Q7J79_11770, partial [Gemmatimonadales bacterium]|nr:hypothetical protein [Gemmatimonadales bacterium]
MTLRGRDYGHHYRHLQLFGDGREQHLLGTDPGAYSQNMPKSFKLYSIATAVAAVILLWTAGWDVSTRDLSAQWNAVAAFLVLGFLAEASYIRLSVGRTETQSSVAFIPYIASVLLFDTGWAALVAAGSVLAVESAVKRKAALRVLFNVSQMVVSV